ncbi:ATP-binding cassette, subfamily C, CydC [Sanguibacter gelidistatuariae]|uniref:ATP-binding cassette, subfamily C, CydC n=1 Tax=Sanguibacter gelidistatuariae TaxID=1814289 RepID=A0A1G6WJ70_9MICO|nr:thiol reductant ABC exporter subunit CydC [Sanguibacter gelidistatuariae]SDD66010.1 ATP-binding cassette, subfamily C, CydC [Sanguibacter gelidistatuariae]
MSRWTRWRQDPLRRAVALLDIDRRHAAGAVGLGVLALGSAIALAAVSAWLIARASQMPPVLTLSVATVAVRAFGISRGVFRYLERLASHAVALRGMASLRTRIYADLAAGRIESVAALRRGDLLARVGADVDTVGDVVVRGLLPAAVATVLGAGSVALICAVHAGTGIALALCLVLAGIVGPWLAARGASTTEKRSAQARSDLAAISLDIIDNAAALTVSGMLETRRKALREADARLAAATDSGARTSGLASAVAVLATGLAVLTALVLAIPSVTNGSLSPVSLAVVVLTPLAVFEITQVLPAAAIQVHRSREAATRIMALLDAAAAGEPAAPDDTVAPPAATSLVASGLVCGWPGQPPTLSGLDLTLTPGRSVALVGPSGTGKTTALLTLAGLIPSRGGSLLLDGRPTARISHDQAAGSVVFTAEDAHVFNTSILENLRVARGSVTEAEAVGVLHRAGLGGWLAQLPEGVHTRLGADASSISGGERRRLLLARALCSPAPILLVDEPAEHLDPVTADALLTDLLTLGKSSLEATTQSQRAVVVATHRLSALAAADEVIVIDSGVVRARGTHAELLAADPAYRQAVAGEDQLV